MKIGIYSNSDELKKTVMEFYKTRPDFTIDDDYPQILHFFDTNVSALKGLIKKKKPDLIISHFRSFFAEIKSAEIYWAVHSRTDIFTSTSVLTNSPKLCKIYFKRIGLQKMINSILEKKKNPENDSSRTLKFTLWNRLCEIMMWQ